MKFESVMVPLVIAALLGSSLLHTEPQSCRLAIDDCPVTENPCKFERGQVYLLSFGEDGSVRALP